MTLPRVMFFVVLLAFLIPLFAGMGILAALIACACAFGVRKLVFDWVGGMRGKVEIQVDELPHAHGEHEDHHHGHDDHGQEAGAGPATVELPYWRRDPRVYILLPLAAIGTVIAELLLWGVLVYSGNEHFWNGSMVIGVAALCVAGFVGGGLREIGEGGKNVRAVARFWGRYLAIDFKSGIQWGLFPSLFTVHEYPLVSPEHPEKAKYGEYQLPEDGAEIFVMASLQYALRDGWVALATIHLFGGVEAVGKLSGKRIDSALEMLTADRAREPHNLRQAISAESLPLFRRAIEGAPSAVYGVKPVIVELVVSGTPEFEEAAAARGKAALGAEALQVSVQAFKERVATISGVSPEDVKITTEQAIRIASTLPSVGGDTEIAIAAGLGGDIGKAHLAEDRKQTRAKSKKGGAA